MKAFIFSISLLAAALSPLSALRAQAPAAAPMDKLALETVETALNAAQSGDAKKLMEQYVPGAVFVDEFAPFFWSGPGSMAAYFASAQKMYQETGMSDTAVSHGTPKFSYLGPSNAYVVVPLDVRARLKERRYHATGVLVFALQKTSSGWKIASQSWAKATENINPYSRMDAAR
jgi:ketosteroid isomerase-like protein